MSELSKPYPVGCEYDAGHYIVPVPPGGGAEETDERGRVPLPHHYSSSASGFHN